MASKSAAGRVQCDRLAVALSPEANVPNQIDRLLGAMLDSLSADKDGFSMLEERYPGMRDAVAQRVRPVLLSNSLAVLPLYRADVANFYCGELTVSQVVSAADFFSSPDGVAMIAASSVSVDYKRAADALAAERNASLQEIEADKRGAGVRVAKMLSPAQKARIEAFVRSPVGKRLVALAPRRNVIDQKWFNYARPGDEKAVELATIEAIIDHIAKTDPATAAKMRANLEAQGTIPKKS